MSTKATISRRNPDFLPKHRYLELVHLCLQYDDMIAEHGALLQTSVRAVQIREGPGGSAPGKSPTEENAIRAAELSKRIDAVRRCAYAAAGPRMAARLIRNVTKGKPYDVIQAEEGEPLPISNRQFYKQRRRFFWLLDKEV